MRTSIPSHLHTRRAVRLALATLALAVPLAACGGGDDDASTDTTAAASTDGSAASTGDESGQGTDADADAAAEEMISDAVTGDGDGSFGLDLETRADAIKGVLDIEDYSIDGSTLTLVFADGTNEYDAPAACMAAGGVMGEGETVVVEYPDGSTTC